MNVDLLTRCLDRIPSQVIRATTVRVLWTLVLLLAAGCGAADEQPSDVAQSAAALEAEITPSAAAVSASSDDGNVPSNTVDNNVATRCSATGDGQWIRYDLGEPRRIAFLTVAFYRGTARRFTFDIQVSSDATSWTTVFSGSSSGATDAPETFDFIDQVGRWVRIVGHGNTSSSWNSYTEVDIFGGAPISDAKFPIAGAVVASTDDGNVAANTVDGSLATRWSGFGDGAWIRYDLGSTKRVAFVRIAFFNGASRIARFDVQVSPDAATWVTVLSNATSSGTTLERETFDFVDASARFVRIVGHGNSTSAWNSYTEVEVWGGS